jgi:hypothetical protein
MFVKSVTGLRIEGDRKIERLPEEKGDLKRIREWPAAGAWRKRAPLFEGAGLRDEAAIADALSRAGDALSTLLAGPTDEVTWDEMFYSFWELADETTNRNRFNWPFIGAPIGLRLGEKSAEREGEVLWAVADVKEWLYASGDKAQRALLMNEIGDRLRYPDRLQAELRGIKGAKGTVRAQLALALGWGATASRSLAWSRHRPDMPALLQPNEFKPYMRSNAMGPLREVLANAMTDGMWGSEDRKRERYAEIVNGLWFPEGVEDLFNADMPPAKPAKRKKRKS